MALPPAVPEDIYNGQNGHAAIHNTTNDLVNAIRDELETGRLSEPALTGQFAPVGRTTVVLGAGSLTTLVDAIAALPSTGGTVVVPEGSWPAGDWAPAYMDKPNVRILGAKMPRPSANGDRLEAGSVIHGSFRVFADGFECDSVGFDLGKHVIDTYYTGADTTIAPSGVPDVIDDWTAFAFFQPNQVAPLDLRHGVRIGRIIGLLERHNTLGHALLFEGMDGVTIDHATGICGTHATVIKSSNVRAGTLAGYSAGTNAVILKSDSYAVTENVTIDAIDVRRHAPGVTLWNPPPSSAAGLHLDVRSADMSTIQIGQVSATATGSGITIDGGGGTRKLDGLQIGSLYAQGSGGAMNDGIYKTAVKVYRAQIGRAQILNAANGLRWDNAANDEAALSVDVATLVNTFGRGIELIGYAQVRITQLDLATAPYAYKIADTARLLIGGEKLTGIATGKWEVNPPALTANWVNGGPDFDIVLRDFGAAAVGLVSRAGPSGVIANLPAYLTPTATFRQAGGAAVSGSVVPCSLGVHSDGGVTTQDGVDPGGSTAWVDLSGLYWRL